MEGRTGGMAGHSDAPPTAATTRWGRTLSAIGPDHGIRSPAETDTQEVNRTSGSAAAVIVTAISSVG